MWAPTLRGNVYPSFEHLLPPQTSLNAVISFCLLNSVCKQSCTVHQDHTDFSVFDVKVQSVSLGTGIAERDALEPLFVGCGLVTECLLTCGGPVPSSA